MSIHCTVSRPFTFFQSDLASRQATVYMHLKVRLSHFYSFHPQQQLPELMQTQMQLYKLAAICHPTGVKHHDAPSNSTMVTRASVLPRSQLPDRNAGSISFRRRKMNVSTCNTVQPCRQDAGQGRAAFCVEFEMNGDRVQPATDVLHDHIISLSLASVFLIR